MFDVKVGSFWLEKSEIANIATILSLDTPTIWVGTIQDAINKVKTLPTSIFGDFTEILFGTLLPSDLFFSKSK